MKSNIIKITAATVLMMAGHTLAADMPPLAQKYNCTNCHAIDVKMIGPSWMAISKAYNGKGKTGIRRPVSEILGSKTAEEWLKHKISHGGAGVWGTVLMPSIDPRGTWQKEMEVLIRQIMGLSKGSTSTDEMLKTMNKHQCVACHDMDKKVIGPSWMDISNFYNSNGTTPYGMKASDILESKTAQEWLMFKISHGGLGDWGSMLMPAMEYVVKPGSFDVAPDEEQRYKDMRELIDFIMGLAEK